MSAHPLNQSASAGQKLSAQLVAEVRLEAVQTAQPLMTILQERTGLSSSEFIDMLGHALDYPSCAMTELFDLTPDFDALPYVECMARHCVVVRPSSTDARPVTQSRLLIADPFDLDLLAWARQRLGADLAGQALLCHPDDLAAWMHHWEERLSAMDKSDGPAATVVMLHDNAEVLSLQSISADTSPIIKLVNSTLYDSLKAGASDIHLESDGKGLVVKFRIDGVLSVISHMTGLDTAEQIISRIKVMSELDIAERRVPQDGRLKVVMKGRPIDIRVSIMPSIYGEDAVLRILDRQALAEELSGLSLDPLGFDEETVTAFRKLCKSPYGMILVTGPTGSGKTTTLYGAITETQHVRDKIITIEDPVEYQLAGVLQIPVNEKKGLTFARGLRSILRHDPDKILVGEIRDPETAQIAVQSALTGHLVFTTVHANNVFDALGRFTQLGIDAYSFVSALNGILAQRLLRKICPDCAEAYVPQASELAASGIEASANATDHYVRARGCAHCRGTGYKGRFAVGEFLRLDDQVRTLIAQRAPMPEIQQAAKRLGLKTLRERAVAAAQAGQTTLEEIDRVTFMA